MSPTHWHTLTRTAKCEKLVRRQPGPFIEVHPTDAANLGVREGDLVQVSSRRGTIQVPVHLSEGGSPGMVFLPFNWGDLFARENAANYLTISAIGRVAKQPELKFCAVNLEKVPAPHSETAASPDHAGEAAETETSWSPPPVQLPVPLADRPGPGRS